MQRDSPDPVIPVRSLPMKTRTQRIKTSIKGCVSQVIFGARLHYRLLAGTAAVVTFHRVNDMAIGDGLTCSVDLFRQYCQFFADHFNVVSLPEVVTKLEERRPLDRELAITFDDGYRDSFDYAAPVLKAMGLPATFFVVTQFIGTEFVACWDRDQRVRHPWMTWNEVRSLQAEGFDVGAHTRTHPRMASVSTPEARAEILGSRLELEQQLGGPVTLFAHPYGRDTEITEGHRAIIRAAGFRCCCSCSGGVNVTGTDPFQLQRIAISSWYTSPQPLGCDLVFRRA
jgi:Polysaccharide deacetylase